MYNEIILYFISNVVLNCGTFQNISETAHQGIVRRLAETSSVPGLTLYKILHFFASENAFRLD